VLMTNHVHLLVTPEDANGLATLMRSLGRRYVQYFNHRYARTGTLWEGRFQSVNVMSRQYFFACTRYIESNPVRADMVASAADYRWSSFRHNACGDVQEDFFLIAHDEYLGLGPNIEACRASYRSMFDVALSEDEIGRLRAEMRGRPAADTAYRRAVVSQPRWAALRHLLHEDVVTPPAP
jgi:putative transposase